MLYPNFNAQSLIKFSLVALFVGTLSACGGGGGSSSSGGNPDVDGDGVENTADNCSSVANADQADVDGDGIGDACDSVNNLDTDGDGVANASDNCPSHSNADQADSDNDGKGNVCDDVNDFDTDNDGIENTVDNCPTVKNPNQNDLVDGDGIGDACDNLDNNCLTDITKRDGCGYTADSSNAVTFDGIWLGFIDGIENEGSGNEVRVKMRFMATLLTVPTGAVYGAYSGKTYAFGCALANVPVTVQKIDSTHSTLGFNFSAPDQPLFNYNFSLDYEKSSAKTKQMQGVVSGGGGNSFSGSVTLKRIEADLTILDLGGNLPKFPGDLDLTVDDVTTDNMKVMCYAQAERKGYAYKQGNQLAFTQRALAVGGIDGVDLDKVIKGQTDYFNRTAASYAEITEWEGITTPDILFNVRNEIVSTSTVGFAYFDTINQSTARLVKDYSLMGPFNEQTGQMIPLSGGLGMETRSPDDVLIKKADFSFSLPLN